MDTAEPTGGRPIRVLLVDDHEMVAQGLALALERAGIEVAGRADGLAAGVRQAVALRPDLVLLDFRLPDGDAIEGLRLLTTQAPGLPVLVLSAVTDSAVAAETLRAGAAGYLTKDLPIGDLAAAVAAATRGETVIAPALVGGVVSRLRNPATRAGGTLTEREREVLSLLVQGLGVDDIASRLVVSRNTVRKHVQSVLVKLGAHTQLEAVAIARREGIVDPG